MIPPSLLDAAEAAHATPGRAYHTWDHALAVLAEVRRTPGWGDVLAAELAAILHDAVYVPGASDNEARSATLAEALLTAHGLERHLPAVQAMILATAHHGQASASDTPPDVARFLDCDMSILGADPDTFDAYDRGVAREYAALPPALYAAGRAAFFDALLAAPRLFLTDAHHARLDGPARANLRRARARLQDTPPGPT
jgi:predicted metal-dependent HD superfamily phosphohydrolase